MNSSSMGGTHDSTSLDLALARDGDQEGFRRFVEATEVDVRRFCAWLCQPSADLDDLLQETYVRAFRGLSSFRAESSGRSWLLSIARRVCADHVRHVVRDRRNLAVAPTSDDRMECLSGYVDMIAIVDNLSTHHREAFVLVAVFGFSYDEAARMLGCPRGTVQSRVARARRQLIEATKDSAVA